MFFDREFSEQYPALREYTTPLKRAERPIVGRETEKDRLMAAMMRPELCNVILLAEAGSGKTALVQGTMLEDNERYYIEVDLSRMISDCAVDVNQMSSKLKQLFQETEKFCRTEKTQIVLFMDEFHQVVQLSSAAVEALKPLLADSGTRGIRVIAATTFVEFRKWISPNQPLVERLQRINLEPPSKKMVVQILRSMAERYGVEHHFYDNHLFELIYEYTNRYIPANAQPRKSILMFDSMVGWYRYKNRRLDAKLLADVIYESEGVQVAFRVAPDTIKSRLDEKVLAQDYATKVIANRLQICVADLNNKSKPMSSFLFTGSTGVGKGLIDDELVPVWCKDGSIFEKRNGDLIVGDYVFNRKGEPVEVTGVYHRGLQDVYKVSFNDGRSIITDGSHLWTYLLSKGKYSANTYTNSTKELYERGVYIEGPDGRKTLRYWIPMNQAVQYPEAKLSVDPYVMGVFIGDGCLTMRGLTLSSDDEIMVAKVAERLGGCTYAHINNRSFNWIFPLIEKQKNTKNVQMESVFKDYPAVCGKHAEDKRIPVEYMHSSVDQRWELIRGLFDTDGSIGDADGGRYNVSYSTISFGLAQDIQTVLYSLGVASTIQVARKATDEHCAQYRLNVKSSNENKTRFFWLPRKVAIAEKARVKAGTETKSRKKDYEWVGISSIEPLSEQMCTTCIMVEDDEHLYQAGQYIVTHNTEVTKQLAHILFNDSRRLIRFDMTEYANPDSLDHFRRELTARVWERPYSIILLDEIEKACSPVTRVLLQVLDDGRLMDDNNREVPFVNSYIVLTTNAGSEIYKDIAQYAEDDTGSGAMLKRYEKLIRTSISTTTGDSRFPPELLGRIDCIVPFQPLSEETQRRIVTKKLQDLMNEVRDKHGINVNIKKAVIDYIVKDNLDTDANAGGARAAIAKLESDVTTAIAAFINAYPDVPSIVVDVRGDMAFKNKTRLESTAFITVAPVANTMNYGNGYGGRR